MAIVRCPPSCYLPLMRYLFRDLCSDATPQAEVGGLHSLADINIGLLDIYAFDLSTSNLHLTYLLVNLENLSMSMSSPQKLATDMLGRRTGLVCLDQWPGWLKYMFYGDLTPAFYVGWVVVLGTTFQPCHAPGAANILTGIRRKL